MIKHFIPAIFLLFPLALMSQEVRTVTYHDNLQMDIYLPDGRADGIVLFVHGGGFSGGKREDGDKFCRNILEMNKNSDVNYAAITMSYRLLQKDKGFGCDVSSAQKKKVFLESGRDIAYAADWILKNGAEYGLPSDRIILAGSSAGAEAVLHAAYWEETRKTDAGERILPAGFHYSAVISMAGALFDLSLITRENMLPTLLLHGTCDNLVPYASAPHHYCDESESGYLMLHGSGSIADRLSSLNANYMLVSECGGGHEWAGKPQDEEFSKVRLFLSGMLAHARSFSYEEVIPGEANCNYPDLGICSANE